MWFKIQKRTKGYKMKILPSTLPLPPRSPRYTVTLLVHSFKEVDVYILPHPSLFFFFLPHKR